MGTTEAGGPLFARAIRGAAVAVAGAAAPRRASPESSRRGTIQERQSSINRSFAEE
jgi:hypothetical protein